MITSDEKTVLAEAARNGQLIYSGRSFTRDNLPCPVMKLIQLRGIKHHPPSELSVDCILAAPAAKECALQLAYALEYSSVRAFYIAMDNKPSTVREKLMELAL